MLARKRQTTVIAWTLTLLSFDAIVCNAKSNVDDNPDSGGAVRRKAFTLQEQSSKIYLPSGVEHWAPSPQKSTIFLGVTARTGNTDSQSNPSFYGYRKYIRHNEGPGLFNIVTPCEELKGYTPVFRVFVNKQDADSICHVMR